ncbi:hypothetical protein [Hyphococcus sp.]|uniref:COG4223 family protein n=1 Tax=Hyphococcus sp. TaxID=2038636 RepID=UPI003D0C70EF
MTQDGDSKAKKEEESLPEVEAELVSETPPPQDAFEDDAPADSPPQDAVQGDAGGAGADNGGDKSEPVKRKSTLTPGVMLFLAFVVVALIAFAVWRFQMAPGAAPAEDAPAAAEETAPDVSDGESVSETPDEPETAPEIDEPETAAKIGNLPDDDLKPSDAPAESSGYLPPVTEDGAAKISNSVEDGAKEAMRRFGEGEDAAVEAPSTEEGIDGAVVESDAASSVEAAENAAETAAMETPPPSEEEAAAGSAQPVDESVAAAAQAEEAAVALQAEMESMRAAFEEERAQLAASLDAARAENATQAEELSRLRAELENRNSAVDDEITRLREELQKVRNDRAQQSARQMKASFALAALSRAVEQGDPYTEELAVIEEFEPGAGSALEAHAETGVATDAALRIGFDAAARKALAAAGQAQAGGGLSGLMARAKNLVSVRPARPLDGDDPGAVLSRAEHALEQGEIGFALLQLEDLPLVAQEAMAEWMAEARARAEAEAAVASLTAQLSGDAE